MKQIEIIKILLLAYSTFSACKPPKIDSTTNAIVGSDGDGRTKALALMPAYSIIREMNLTKVSRIENIQEKAEIPTMALIECAEDAGKSPEQSINELSGLSRLDRVFTTTEGTIVVKEGSEYRKSHCVPIGTDLVTFPIIESAFFSISQLPAHGGTELDQRAMKMAQTFFLALRGTYYPNISAKDGRPSGTLEFVSQMSQRHYGTTTISPIEMLSRLKRYDPDFVSCYAGNEKGVLPAYAQKFVANQYKCTPFDGGYNFQPEAASYAKTKADLAEAISLAHVSVYKFLDPSKDPNIQLFNAVTSTNVSLNPKNALHEYFKREEKRLLQGRSQFSLQETSSDTVGVEIDPELVQANQRLGVKAMPIIFLSERDRALQSAISIPTKTIPIANNGGPSAAKIPVEEIDLPRHTVVDNFVTGKSRYFPLSPEDSAGDRDLKHSLHIYRANLMNAAIADDPGLAPRFGDFYRQRTGESLPIGEGGVAALQKVFQNDASLADAELRRMRATEWQPELNTPSMRATTKADLAAARDREIRKALWRRGPPSFTNIGFERLLNYSGYISRINQKYLEDSRELP